MLRHTLLLIYRNFQRYKSPFFINLIGLSTGLACALLIYLWVNHELNVDKFLENDSQLYQVMQNIPTPSGIETGENTPGLLAEALVEEMPEVKYATPVARPSWFGRGRGFIAAEGDHLKATGQFVEEDYLNVFSLNLVLGNRKQIFGDKYAVLISDELAKKLFSDEENIIGKTVEWEDGWYDGLYHISGIFEKFSRNSSVQLDLLFNYQLYYEKHASNLDHWGNSNPSTFVVLNEGTDVEKFNEKIRDFRKLKYRELVGTKYLDHIGTLFLQRYSDRYLYNRFENGVQAGGRITYVKLFSMIALFILAIASINFMNLSTARASRRMKEIGIKKVVGSDRRALIFQFLGESVLIAFLSLGLALQLVLLLLPEFNEITGKHLHLNFSSNFIISVLAITLVTGILSGSYPALYLSRLRPVVVLKGKLSPSAGETWVRKGLVVFQFAISVILIVAVLVVFKQIEFIQTKNLGVNKDNIITFKKEGQLRGNPETFLQQVSSMPEVVNVTSSWHNLTGRHGSTGGLRWEGRDPDARIWFGNLEIDYSWIETMGVEMVEGRPFSREFGSDSTKIIFNEAAIAVMGLEDPIGKTVKLWGKERQIIGVTKNFHFESLYESVKPCFMQCLPNGQNILVKIKAGLEQEAIERIGDLYREYNEGFPFDYKFIDQDFQELYIAEKRVASLSRYFAGVAIVISCLGLFGMAAFTAERRIKEIGIRKILGSGVWGIIYLLSGDFTKMVITSIIIALPTSYFIARSWLEGFAYRIDLELWFFISAGLIALLIAWFTISLQTVKAARVNPVECLQDE